jgi:hypothetical protein
LQEQKLNPKNLTDLELELLGNSTLFPGVPLLVFLEKNESIWIPSDSSPVFTTSGSLGLTKGSEAIAPAVVGFGFGSSALAERGTSYYSPLY